MQNPATTLYCPNPRCQAPNPPSHNFCQNCRTPLCKRYLWAVGESLEAFSPGQLMQERYLFEGNRILLDTKPGLAPEIPEEIPPELAPYLKLSPYRLHLSQVYGGLTLTPDPSMGRIWLLEQAPIYTNGPTAGSLMPELASVWKSATALRQLNWLWQIASLWQPLSAYGVASSLLFPVNLRVEESIVRLLELHEDRQSSVTLKNLGHLWSEWASSAQPAVKNFIEKLSAGLLTGQIKTSEQLVDLLDRGLAEKGRSRTSTYQIFTCTDKGPSRRRNEDACYPPSGTRTEIANLGLEERGSRENFSTLPLAIVCDGIGGHEGGDVASKLAIETIRQQVENLLSSRKDWTPIALSLELERAALAANEAISQRNDSERRHDRQRMGTTLVMALAQEREVYITHVGDSRVYRVTKTGCHQITLDDDIASREVRLGYALYHDAVQQPASGSLVQALGMGSSSLLHPTVQRLVIDEDCIFLLCSDGLSDNDRVEQYWETEIVPVLDGQIDLAIAGQRLVDLGNTQNGHDNVTVALVYCQVRQLENSSDKELPAIQIEASQPDPASQPQTRIAQSAPSQMKTQQLPQRSSLGHPWTIVLCFLLLGLLGGGLFYFWPELLSQISQQSSSQTPTPATVSPSSSPTPTSSSPVPDALAAGALIKVQGETTKNSKGQTVPLLLWREFEPPNQKSAIGKLPVDSILQVIQERTSREQESWLQLKVCSTPGLEPKAKATELSPKQVGQLPKVTAGQPALASRSSSNSVTYGLVQHGEVGWIPRAEVVPVSRLMSSSSNSPVPAECPAASNVSPSPTSTGTP